MPLNSHTIPPVVTCHAGARDNYQLSLAFDEIHLLDTLVTDFYTPNYFGSLLKKRFHENLSSSKVSWKAFDCINGYIFKRYLQLGRDLSLRAAKLAIENQSNLFVTSYTANTAFEYLTYCDSKINKYLFQLHPHPDSIIKILNEEISLGHISADDLSYEAELDPVFYPMLANEAFSADQICVASSFTKKSLVSAGVSEEKIHVIPYGVDHNLFSSLRYKKTVGKLKILFCGQFIHRKGIFYLYDALKQLGHQHYELLIVTRGECDKKTLSMFLSNLNVRLYKNISSRVLIELMHSSDLFILPSLYEGFGHVILEAMSAGLPVITTVNTAGIDLIEDNENGFVGPIRDANFLLEKISFFLENPMAIKEYGEKGAITSQNYTWKTFRKKIADFYIFNERMGI
jgi:glycosyltransferase involved in cell wall biosynthesis